MHPAWNEESYIVTCPRCQMAIPSDRDWETGRVYWPTLCPTCGFYPGPAKTT